MRKSIHLPVLFLLAIAAFAFSQTNEIARRISTVPTMGQPITIYYEPAKVELPDAPALAKQRWGVNEYRKGNWKKLPEPFVPPSRLGWSNKKGVQSSMILNTDNMSEITLDTPDTIKTIHFAATDGSPCSNNNSANWNVFYGVGSQVVAEHRDTINVDIIVDLAESILNQSFSFADSIKAVLGYFNTAKELITVPLQHAGFSTFYYAVNADIVSTNGMLLDYQYVKTKGSAEYPEVYYNFNYEGETTGEAQMRQIMVTSSHLSIVDTVFSKTDSRRMPSFNPLPHERLYLKDNNMLSWEPFPPYPPNTTQGYNQVFIFDEYSWKYPLDGDINDSNYTISLLVGCYGLGSAEMKADLIWRHDSNDVILASIPTFTGDMAGSTPLGYMPPSREEFTITGEDANTVFGDTLIFTVTKIGGDRVGLIFIQELNEGYSWIEIGEIVNPGTLIMTESINASPEDIFLSQNYPNPFNPVTLIQYGVKKKEHVKLSVFNVLGEEIASLVDMVQLAGSYNVKWDGRDHFGRQVGSGLYFYRIEAGDFDKTRKMMLMR
jgi:hypothetical protein